MEGRILTADIIDDFRKKLELQEKSTATIEKYIRDVKAFSVYAQDEVITKDIAKLADILGHSSINTTRIYIISTGTEHRRRMENMHLII